MLVCESGDKASDAMFIPRFISEIPLTKPLDVVRPENSTDDAMFVPLCPPNTSKTPDETQR
jgi:hypothetical protein